MIESLIHFCPLVGIFLKNQDKCENQCGGCQQKKINKGKKINLILFYIVVFCVIIFTLSVFLRGQIFYGTNQERSGNAVFKWTDRDSAPYQKVWNESKLLIYL